MLRLLVFCCCLWLLPSTTAAPPKTEPAPAPGKTTPTTIDPLIAGLVTAAIPAKYEDKKKWGGTKEVFAGLKISRRGLRILTKRRTKRVNHGTWKKYLVQLADRKQLVLKYGELTKSKSGQLRFSVAATGDLFAHARLAQWEHGVQLLSLSADADAKVTLAVTCEVGLRRTGAYIPTVGLDLKVIEADLKIDRFRLRRLSNIRGPVARELGRGVEHFLKRYLKKNRVKLVEKLNRSLAKKKQKLKASVSNFFGIGGRSAKLPTAADQER